MSTGKRFKTCSLPQFIHEFHSSV